MPKKQTQGYAEVTLTGQNRFRGFERNKTRRVVDRELIKELIHHPWFLVRVFNAEGVPVGLEAAELARRTFEPNERDADRRIKDGVLRLKDLDSVVVDEQARGTVPMNERDVRARLEKALAIKWHDGMSKVALRDIARQKGLDIPGSAARKRAMQMLRNYDQELRRALGQENNDGENQELPRTDDSDTDDAGETGDDSVGEDSARGDSPNG